MNRLVASYIVGGRSPAPALRGAGASLHNGSTRGESHGGLFLVDLDRRTTHRPVDWNLQTFNWREYEGDCGLRGLAVDGDTLYVASSKELLAFSKDFRLRKSWQNPYLRNCQDICIWQRTLFVVSAGCDCILAFDLDQEKFHWAMHITRKEFKFLPHVFDPDSSDGPLILDKLHLNSVYCDANGMYITGSKSGGMLHFSGQKLNMAAELPPGSHNARPYRAGVLFHDTGAGAVRYAGREDMHEDRALPMPTTLPAAVPATLPANFPATLPISPDTQPHPRDENAKPFGRGLCLLSDRVIACGSTPATITLYDLAANRQLVSVVLSRDVQHSIHSLAVWPFD